MVLGPHQFPRESMGGGNISFYSTKMDENGSCSMVSWQSEGGPPMAPPEIRPY